MNAAELRRAMRLLPLWTATTALAGVTAFAAAAIDEALPVWLACGLAVALVGGAVVAAIIARRPYRRRLEELQDPITSSWPAAEPIQPVPIRLRLWLIGVPALAVAVLVLVAVTPGVGDTCVSKGITAGQEGVCVRGQTLFGGGTTYNVVDAGHVLHMPGFDVRLLATSAHLTRVSNAAQDPSDYPDGIGTWTAFEVAITNRGSLPLAFDVGGSDVGLILQVPHDGQEGDLFREEPDVTREPFPRLASLPAISPGRTVIGWVAFVVPRWGLAQLNRRATDLEFFVPTRATVSSTGDYIGQLRLWKAANAQGARAIASGAQ